MWPHCEIKKTKKKHNLIKENVVKTVKIPDEMLLLFFLRRKLYLNLAFSNHAWPQELPCNYEKTPTSKLLGTVLCETKFEVIPYKSSVLFYGRLTIVQSQIRHRIMRCLIRNFSFFTESSIKFWKKVI